MGEKLRDQLIGAWKLVSCVEKPVDGSAPYYPLGDNAEGIVVYTPHGYMSAQLMRSGRRAFPPATDSTARTRTIGRKPRHTSHTPARSVSMRRGGR